ncbi:MAG: hypothetical protein HY017_03800 [Betaproteobacteria bacterium]|nr:hypothetical protein [Betaproteobacteria bacterium]
MRSNCKLVLSDVIALLATAGAAYAQDAKRGEKLYEERVACHSKDRGAHGVGPSLHGVIGRKAAELAIFSVDFEAVVRDDENIPASGT